MPPTSLRRLLPWVTLVIRSDKLYKKLAIHITSGGVTFVVSSPDFFDFVCNSVDLNTLCPLHPCDCILTGCHNCICYVVLRHRCSCLIHCTSLFDFVSYCTSPFSLIYSFLTLCGCHFLGASPLWLWAIGCFWRFADLAPQLFIHYSLTSRMFDFFHCTSLIV